MRALVIPFLLVLSLATLATQRAHAQTSQTSGFALDRFDPAERGSEWFVLDTLDFRKKGGHLRPAVGVVADYAYKPLVFYDQNGKEAAAFVEHQLFLHFGASIALWDRVRFAVNLPVAAAVKGTSGSIDGVQYNLAEGGQLGDLRLSADVRLFGHYRGVATMAIGVSVWAPTGSQEAYTGDGKVRVAPHVNLAGQIGIFAYGAKLGVNVRPQDEQLANVQLGTELFGGVSAGLRLANGKLLIGPEVYASTVFKGGAFDRESTPVEGLLSAHYCVANVVRLGGGVGAGFTHGFGSPKVRALFSAEWAPCEFDRDGDGILDENDACPDVPGVSNPDPKKNGCPRTDRDGDGIFDDEDACPDEPGIPSSDPAKNGCPLRDRDHDHILDDDDACPDLPGVASDDPEKNGCPDTDGDGIIDPKDACPTVPGPPNEDPKKNGCPPARIEHGQIRILEQVKFKTDSAEILSESDGLLEAVVAILDAHPEITKLAVQGHTDNVGAASYNKQLSERRAASVAKWLGDHHVDRARLSSAGFGLEVPIADNDTADGRRENRRVEFHIVEIEGRPVDASDAPRDSVDEGIEP
jgi:outer membrane protein OmpA-like peptidoglycan-associated protein